MKFIIALFAVSAVLLCVNGALRPVVPATTYLRTPEFDSAIVQSDRFGGSFSYSTVEGQAYQAISPVVRNVFQPVGLTYPYNALPLHASPLYFQQPLYTYPTVQFLEPQAAANQEIKTEENKSDTVTVESA